MKVFSQSLPWKDLVLISRFHKPSELDELKELVSQVNSADTVPTARKKLEKIKVAWILGKYQEYNGSYEVSEYPATLETSIVVTEQTEALLKFCSTLENALVKANDLKIKNLVARAVEFQDQRVTSSHSGPNSKKQIELNWEKWTSPQTLALSLKMGLAKEGRVFCDTSDVSNHVKGIKVSGVFNSSATDDFIKKNGLPSQMTTINAIKQLQADASLLKKANMVYSNFLCKMAATASYYTFDDSSNEVCRLQNLLVKRAEDAQMRDLLKSATVEVIPYLSEVQNA